MVYMYHSFLVHSSADGHLGCFHVLAMTNSVAMNSGVHMSLSDLVSLVYMPIAFNLTHRIPGGSDCKESACSAGDPSSIPGSGRFPGKKNDNSLQYSCLENPMDRGAWWATVHGVAKSQTCLSNNTFTLSDSLIRQEHMRKLWGVQRIAIRNSDITGNMLNCGSWGFYYVFLSYLFIDLVSIHTFSGGLGL